MKIARTFPLLLLAAGAFAAPIAPDDELLSTWEILVNGSAAGTETVTASPGMLSSRGGFAFQGVSIATRYEMSFGEARGLREYTATVGAGGTEAQFTASVSGETVKVTVTQGGAVVGERTLPFTDTTVLLDNNIASQYRTLARVLDPAGVRAAKLRMLTPQALAEFPVDVTLREGTWRWKAGTREGTAVRWEISSPSPVLLVPVYQDILSREIVWVEIPQARVVYRLAGVAITREAAPPAPSYLDASRVQEKEVRITAGSFSVMGTLAWPKTGKGPFPGVLLLSGSGPNDRDETVGGTRPLRDIAVGLANRGFAVLRFEKRTWAYRMNIAALAPDALTLKEEYFDDAAAALKVLAADPLVDGKRLSVAGHSLGGWVLPSLFAGLGAERDRIRHLVLLAPGGTDLGETLLSQIRFRLSLAPENESMKAALAEAETGISALRSGGTFPGLLLGASAAYWKDVLSRDPAAPAKATAVDMLLVRGEKDFQCSAEDFAGWQAALGTRKNTAFVTLPELNHLFVETEGQSTGVEYFREGYVSQGLVDLLAERLAR